MEDWRTLYQQKLTTAEEAVKHIKSGDRVVVTHATGEPILLTDAMRSEERRVGKECRSRWSPYH